MRLVFTSDAQADIREISRYIKLDSPAAAARVTKRIRETARLLMQAPFLGRAGSLGGTREWVVRGLPYILVYEADIDTDTLVILNVIHGARQREVERGD